MKTLKDAKIGDTVKVVKLHGEGPIKRRIMDMGITKGTEVYIRKVGGSPEVRKHLEDLGFVAGGSATVVSALGGNVIVKVKESRVAISQEMAQKIMV